MHSLVSKTFLERSLCCCGCNFTDPSYFKSSIADVDYYSVLICLFANDTAAINAVAPDQKIVMYSGALVLSHILIKIHQDWMQCLDYLDFNMSFKNNVLVFIGSQGWHTKTLLVARLGQLEQCNGTERRRCSSGTEHLVSSGISCSSSGESN